MRKILLFVVLFLSACRPSPEAFVASERVETAKLEFAGNLYEARYNLNVVEWEAHKFEAGSGFYVGIEAVEVEDGQYDFPELQNQLDLLVDKTTSRCPEADYSRYNEAFYVSVGSGEVSETCWAFLYEETGMKPADRVSSAIMTELEKAMLGYEHSTGYDNYVYITSEGQFLGESSTYMDGDRGCEIKSLEMAGWKVTDSKPLVVDLNNKAVSEILYNTGLYHFVLWDVRIPSFCDVDLMTEVANMPAWVDVAHKNDMWAYYLENGVSVEIHTNAEICDQHNWNQEGYYTILSDADQRIEIILRDGDLIELANPKRSAMAYYLTIIEGVPTILISNDRYWNHVVAGVWANYDGIDTVFVNNFSYIAPYMIDGNPEIFTQHEPELFGEVVQEMVGMK